MEKKISRRSFLSRGLAAAMGLIFAPPLSNTLFASSTRPINLPLKPDRRRAKSIIFLFLNGGPSHTDTFDPKPELGRDYIGNYTKPIQTNNPDLIINEKLPKLASIADKYSIIRSMTHNSNAHEVGQYVIFSGDMSKGSLVYPSFGATIAYMKRDEYMGVLPPFISVPTASTRFNESGFLDSSYKSFSTEGKPESDFYEVDGIIAQGVSASDLEQRRELLGGVNALLNKNIHTNEQVERSRENQAENYELILGNARRIFDLNLESESTRTAYGMNRTGQSCLVARRLVEAGTPVVVVNSPGWDTHKEHFKRMETKLPEIDDAISALILDLEQRGLLDETIVMVGGEFGRTPKVGWEPPWNGGRGHFGAAFSFLVAGGGFKGGQIIGKTSPTGEEVIERPVFPSDLWGTIYYLMGIDPNGTLPHPQLGDVAILPPMPAGEVVSEGIIKELIKA